MVKVLYNSVDEFNKLREQFRTELTNSIKTRGLDKWCKNKKYGFFDTEETNINKQLYLVLCDLLNKLTKNQDSSWCKYQSNIMSNSICGMINHMPYECIQCCRKTDLPEYNEHKEFTLSYCYSLTWDSCNSMITNSILNVLFDECYDNNNGIINGKYGIAQFKCELCTKVFNCDKYNVDKKSCLGCLVVDI